MEGFFAITLIIISIRLYWKHSADSRVKEHSIEPRPIIVPDNIIVEHKTTKDKLDSQKEVEEAQKIVDKQRDQDIADLRKQGYTDELIAVIIPTINNGQ